MEKLFKVLSFLGHVFGVVLTIYAISFLGGSERATCIMGFFLFTVLVEGAQFDVFLENKIINYEWSIAEALKWYDWKQTFWNVSQNLLGVVVYLFLK